MLELGPGTKRLDHTTMDRYKSMLNLFEYIFNFKYFA